LHCKHIQQPENISRKDELDAAAYAGEREGNDSASTDGEESVQGMCLLIVNLHI